MKESLELVTNRKRKFLTILKEGLKECEEFYINVAFITDSGIQVIKQELRELEKRNVQGTIITGAYLAFTEPKALKTLSEFKNIELYLNFNEDLHAKNYVFKRGKEYKVLLGSTNLTQRALTVNEEWNFQYYAEYNALVEEILQNYKYLKDKSTLLDERVLEQYFEYYGKIQKYNDEVKEEIIKIGSDIPDTEIIPNAYQKEVLKELDLAYETEDRGLIISATGTGKTVISGFAVKKYNPGKLLFVVHRENIARKAAETFQKIIPKKKIGFYFGNEKTEDADYYFTTIQTISREKNLQKFSRNEFEYIVIDEVHHSGASSYQTILSYFQPKFLLGLTATPERNDDHSIYEEFNYNVIYELTLQKALSYELLTPFHYYGLADIDLQDSKENIDFLDLHDNQRIDHIVENSKYYGHSSDDLHGLIFVGSIAQGYELEAQLIKRGIHCKFLSGENTEKERAKAIFAFEKGVYKYLITVDIFNEGIDIPKINQIILLRRTQSLIVYIQQIGRGLRRSESKEYVVILDFVGNYDNNYLLPLALSGNSNYNKAEMKDILLNGTESIDGISTITFDRIVQEKIFEQIEKTNFSKLRLVKDEYRYLYEKINRPPLLMDFHLSKRLSPLNLLALRSKKINQKKVRNSYEILRELEYDYNSKKNEESVKWKNTNGVIDVDIDEKVNNNLSFISNFLTPAKRSHEFLIIRYLLSGGKTFEQIREYVNTYLGFSDNAGIRNALMHLMRDIFKTYSQMKEYSPIIKFDGKKYELINNLDNIYVRDLLEYNLLYVQNNYKQKYLQKVDGNLILNKLYTKEEAFHYLNLNYSEGYQVGGYTLVEEQKKVLLFINFDNNSIFGNYENPIFDRRIVVFYSKKNRKLTRNGKITQEGKMAEGYYKMHIFGRVHQSTEFYYLGCVEEVLSAEEERGMIKYELLLQNEIDLGINNILTSE